MAVNLRATATLNTKPYMASLKKLAAENAKLNGTTVRGSKRVKDSVLAEADARVAASKAATAGARGVEAAVTGSTRSIRQSTAATNDYLKTQAESVRIADRITNAYRTMSTAEARHTESKLRTAEARLARMRAVAGGIEGAAMSPYIDRVNASEIRQAKTRESLRRATASNAVAEANLASKLRETNAAHQAGINSARAFTSSLSGLSQEKLKMQAATERLGAAEARLASAMARSNGVITPAVRQARAGVISASAAYNKLAEAQKSAGKAGPRAASGLAAQRYLLHDISRQMTTTSLLMAALPAAAITTAAVWERRFADVVRTADPEFSRMDNRVNALRTSLVSMAQAMPTSFGDITEIATLANQMGIAATQTADFTRAVAMFTATSGVSVDIAASAFGRLTSILGDSRIGFMEMSDAILKVGVNSVATEDEIINVTTQISSIAAQAGFSAKEMIGLSGALASVRVPPELSRGVITRVFGQIDKAVNAGGTGLESLARISGTSAEQFRKDWGTDQSATLFNNFLRGLRDAGSAARSELNALGITSVRDVPVMLRIANAADAEGNVGELFTQTMRDANRAAGETQRQYEFMAETVVGKLKILGNNILAFFDAAGQSGLGMFGDLLDKATKGIRDLTRSLDDPHAIFGIFGKTNADVIGWTVSIGLAASAATLLAGGLVKIGGIIRGLQHFQAIGGIAGLLGLGGAKGGGSAAAAGSGLMAIANGGKQAGIAAGTLKGGLGRLSSFVGGPWVIAIGLGVTALSMLSSKMRENATDSGALATSLASIDTSNLVSLNNELSKIIVPGPSEFLGWEMETRPFEDGVTGFREALDKLDRAYGKEPPAWGKFFFDIGHWTTRTVAGLWDEAAGVEKIDESIQNLVDSGNTPKAAKMLQSLARDGKDLQNLMRYDEGKNIKAFLENAFDLAGIEMTEDNLNRFVRGVLPELTDAMLGLEGVTLNANQLFEGDFERLGQFAQAVDEGAASFINLGRAIEEATTVDANGLFESFDLSAWTNSLQEQIKAQENWGNNLRLIAKTATKEEIEALAAMGEAGTHLVEAIAQSIKDGTPLAEEALRTLGASLETEARVSGNALAEELANIDWAKGLLKNNELADALLSNFNQDALSRVREAGIDVGQEALQGIVESLAKGEINLETAIQQLRLEQPKVRVHTEFDEAALDKGLAAVDAKLKKFDASEFGVELKIDSSTTVRDLKAIIDDPSLNNLYINGNLTLAEAYAESREFQLWAEDQGIDIFLGANDTPARLTLAGVLALANGTIAEVQIAALPAIEAETEIYHIVETADGVTAFVKVRADNGEALEDVAYVVDEAGNITATIPLSADDKVAISKIKGVGEHASRTPAKISVTAIDNATGVIDNIARTRNAYVNVVTTHSSTGLFTGGGRMVQANGGMVDYYANGGVRENHVAQIAPAGTMRVWAEPETGGEAYIPLAKSKRARSVAILDDVAQRFGYNLSAGMSDVRKYADGGFYQLQSRSRYDRLNNVGSGSNNVNRIFNLEIHNPVEKSWSQDAIDYMQELGGALDI